MTDRNIFRVYITIFGWFFFGFGLAYWIGLRPFAGVPFPWPQIFMTLGTVGLLAGRRKSK